MAGGHVDTGAGERVDEVAITIRVCDDGDFGAGLAGCGGEAGDVGMCGEGCDLETLGRCCCNHIKGTGADRSGRAKDAHPQGAVVVHAGSRCGRFATCLHHHSLQLLQLRQADRQSASQR